MEATDTALALPPRAPPLLDFATIFEEQFDYVLFSLRRFGVPERDVEDVAHDVFVQVYLRLDQYDPSRPLRPWLFGFAYRVASDYRRQVRHHVEAIGNVVDVVDPSPSAPDCLASHQAVQLVWAALNELDLDRRAVFVLHEVEGCPIPEVSRTLQIPLNTAYSRLRLAREQFARTLHRLRAQWGGT